MSADTREGHPVRDAWLNQPDPVVNGSQNPVGYCELPEEQPFLYRPCACGCGNDTDRDFLPGHEIRAIQGSPSGEVAYSTVASSRWL